MIAIPTSTAAIPASSTGAGRSPMTMRAMTPTTGTRKRAVPRFANDVRPSNQPTQRRSPESNPLGRPEMIDLPKDAVCGQEIVLRDAIASAVSERQRF